MLYHVSRIAMVLGLMMGALCSHGREKDFRDVSAADCDNAQTCLGNWSFRKDVNEVDFFFTAFVHGKLVPDLVATDVRVLDDRKPPEKVLGFYTQRAIPMRLGILVDTSGSVYSQFRQEQAAAGAFLVDVIRPYQDLAFVMGFSDVFEVKQDFTDNPGKLWHGITTLTDERHNTALFDAVIEGCTKLAALRENHFVTRSLIILSDGEENSSRRTLADAIRAAQAADVTVYAIWIHDPGLLPYNVNEGLTKLVTKLGGRLLSPRSAGELGFALTKLADELHSGYAIAYRPANFNLDGHYRPVRIKAEKRGHRVEIHGRKGYYARIHAPLITEPHQFTALEP